MKANKLFVTAVIGIALIIFTGFFIWNKNSENENKESVQRVDQQYLIREYSPEKGTKTARVTIVEFLDPECEACRSMHPIMKQLLSEYEGKVRLVIRYMPLHGNSKYAAVALEEAREQGKFDEALDILFARQPEWADHARPRPEMIPVLLNQIGLDEKLMESSILFSKHGKKIDTDQADGVKVGVKYTPTFFVNGEMLPDIGYESIKQAIDRALKE